MSNSLKTTFFVHCASFDYKGVLSLIERRYKMWLVSRWLKKAKKRKVLLKKGLSIRVRFFFDSELPYETRTSLSIALHSTFTNSKFILFIEIWINVFVKKDLSLKKIVLKVNNHAKDPIVHTKLQSSITPRKKRNSKKSFYFWILRWTSFLMIPLTFLYDEYIDRPKFTEQKKKTHLSI